MSSPYAGPKFRGPLCLALWLATVDAHALDPRRAVEHYGQDVWSTENGLPSSSVFSVVQTRDGYLWLGTAEGLVRFDGVRFRIFDHRNTPEITQNQIQSLEESRDGSLWIGTYGGGLVRLKEGRFTRYTTREGLAHDVVRAVHEARDGSLWIGTYGGGVSRFQNGHFRNYSTRDGLSNDRVLSLCEARDGTLWIGTMGGGLNHLNEGRMEVYDTRHGLPDDGVKSLLEDEDGTLWIGTFRGLARWRDGRIIKEGAPQGLPRSLILSLYRDRQGNVWVGADAGIYRIARGAGRAESFRGGVGTTPIVCFAEDHEGSLWVGINGGGLLRLREVTFMVYGPRDGLASDRIRAVYQGRDGSLWVGADDGGLSRMKDGAVTVYDNRNGFPDGSIRSICEGRDGSLWFGVFAGGLVRLRNGRFQTYTRRAGLSNDSVFAVYEDSRGALWVGTDNGLSRLNPDGTFTVYTTRDGLTNNGVRSILEDPAGALWVGMEGGGLNKFEQGRFVRYGAKEGLSSEVVGPLYQDSEGTLWIGTQGGGLNRLRNGVFRSFTAKDGLPSDTILQIVEDGRGRLWLGSDNGIHVVRKQDLNDYSERRLHSIPVVSYGVDDGLRSAECSANGQPAAWRTTDDRLWFATRRGLAAIDPEHTHRNDLAPPVRIEEILVDRREVPSLAGAVLSAGVREMEFHYTGLSLRAPKKVTFQYQLAGFDNGWIDAGTRRTAYYTNLPPGPYTFRVKAANDDGVWNTTGASVTFRIRPHFYQTAAFYLICAALAVLAGRGIYVLRLHQMKMRFSAVLAERGRMAREIHDTLAQGFAAISVHLEMVKDTLESAPRVARDHLEQARGLVRESLDQARRSVWDLRDQSPDHANLSEAFARIADQLAPDGRVAIRVSGEPRRLPVRVENHVLRIGQEALTNAVRHAHARTVSLEIDFRPAVFALSVRDDGIGFDASGPSPDGHFGLIGMRERAEQIAGHLTMSSHSQRGTEIVLVVPCGVDEGRVGLGERTHDGGA